MLTLRPGTIYFNKAYKQLNLVLSVTLGKSGYYNLMILCCDGWLYSVNTDNLQCYDSASSNWKILN